MSLGRLQRLCEIARDTGEFPQMTQTEQIELVCAIRRLRSTEEQLTRIREHIDRAETCGPERHNKPISVTTLSIRDILLKSYVI
jgi:hypothetical protein